MILRPFLRLVCEYEPKLVIRYPQNFSYRCFDCYLFSPKNLYSTFDSRKNYSLEVTDSAFDLNKHVNSIHRKLGYIILCSMIVIHFFCKSNPPPPIVAYGHGKRSLVY